MRSGDKLYCERNDIGIVNLSIHKIYEIIEVKTDNSYGKILIHDDVDRIISFTIYVDRNNLSYRNWFRLINIKEERKIKLFDIEHNI